MHLPRCRSSGSALAVLPQLELHSLPRNAMTKPLAQALRPSAARPPAPAPSSASDPAGLLEGAAPLQQQQLSWVELLEEVCADQRSVRWATDSSSGGGEARAALRRRVLEGLVGEEEAVGGQLRALVGEAAVLAMMQDGRDQGRQAVKQRLLNRHQQQLGLWRAFVEAEAASSGGAGGRKQQEALRVARAAAAMGAQAIRQQQQQVQAGRQAGWMDG